MLKGVRKNFVTGLAVIFPAVITIWLVKFIMDRTNDILLAPIVQYLQPYILDSVILEYIAKVLTLTFLVFMISIIGFGTRILLLRGIFSFLERSVYRVPMIGRVYGTMKEMSQAFMGLSKGTFSRVVLIEFPRPGIYAIGFITSEGKNRSGDKTLEKVMNVFVPHAPNPTSGFLLLVPEDEMIKVDMSVEEGFKMVISGGVVPLPERVTIKKKDGNPDN